MDLCPTAASFDPPPKLRSLPFRLWQTADLGDLMTLSALEFELSRTPMPGRPNTRAATVYRRVYEARVKHGNRRELTAARALTIRENMFPC